MKLPELKKQLKQRIALGLNVGLKSIDEALNSESIYRNEFMAYQSQFSDLNRTASMNVLDYAQLEIGFNKIRVGLFSLIDKLSEKDLNIKDELSAPKNNELQYRKNNFFKLIEIHLDNLEKFEVSYASSDKTEKETGRNAMRANLKDSFKYIFLDNYAHRGKFEQGNIIDFCNYYFGRRSDSLDVYFSTISFILEYVLDEELERDFFFGVMRSILSNAEKVFIFYYAISGLDEKFKANVIKSNIIQEEIKLKLIDSNHFQLINEVV